MSRFAPCPRCQRELRSCLHADFTPPETAPEDLTYARLGYPTELAYRRATDPRKVCTDCELSLPLIDFSPRKDRPGKHQARCKSCRAEAQQERQRAVWDAIAWQDVDCGCADGEPCNHSPEAAELARRRDYMREYRARHPKPETARARKIREGLARRQAAEDLNRRMLAKLDEGE